MELDKITLQDQRGGASAEILPGFGFNLFSFQPVIQDKPVQVLWSTPGFTTGKERASHSGIPVLFPFPGRLRGREFTFRGKKRSLTSCPDDGRGNAIHGFVLDRPWRVVEQMPDRATGEFRAAIDEPKLLHEWPSDFLIRVNYELSGNKLLSRIEIQNPGDSELPFTFGTHPYFRVPLGVTGEAANCRVSVPAAEYWELVDMLPSGERLPAEGQRGLAHGLSFAESKLDDVFTSLKYAGDKCVARIVDPHNRRVLSLAFDSNFRDCVVYTPPHREAICIEPYSGVPDAYTLAERGIPTGLRVLTPGGTATYHFEIMVAPG